MKITEQLRLEDAVAAEGGGFRPMRRVVSEGEAWWIPGESVYHVDSEPLRFDHIAAYAVFGTPGDAVEAGARQPCLRCRGLIEERARGA